MKHVLTSSILAICLTVTLTACGGESSGGGSGPEGAWTLDIAAFKDAMKASMEKEMAGKDEAAAKMMKGFAETMLAKFDQASMEVTIKGDGTWEGSSNFPGGASGELEKDMSKGTWTLDGTTITMATTQRNGKEVDPAKDTVTGTLDGDVIRVKADDGDPEMLLRRK